MNRLIITASTDPYYNLALEEAIFKTHSGGAALYLWRNANTVVIGRNQCAMMECDVARLKEFSVSLARRPSGGGAVFHDLGNVNFTFVLGRGDYDVKRQLGVIVSAMGYLGVNANISGRNDIVSQNGCKFSGSAFLHDDIASMHHGTILVDVDMSRLSLVLSPSAEKLSAHSVKSVRSRVVNICELNPSIDPNMVREAIIEAFAAEYGDLTEQDESMYTNTPIFCAANEKFRSFQWRMGKTRRFDVTFTERLNSFTLTVDLLVERGLVKEASLYCDAMEMDFVDSMERAMRGVRLDGDSLAAAVAEIPPYGEEISEFFKRRI